MWPNSPTKISLSDHYQYSNVTPVWHDPKLNPQTSTNESHAEWEEIVGYPKVTLCTL